LRRVLITGLGIVSSIGRSKADVVRSLVDGRSGIDRIPEMKELGFRCTVGGTVKSSHATDSRIPRKYAQTMSDAARFAACAALEALQDAGLAVSDVKSERAAVVVGGSFGGMNEAIRLHRAFMAHKTPSRLGIVGAVRIMGSTASANLASMLGLQGSACSICSSCSSGIDNIGVAYDMIANGRADVCLCGSAEERTWMHVGAYFDNWSGMPTAWNERPEKACRPYDRDRDGTVFSEGAGILIAEELELALGRNARPYAEIVGYGSANDGADMFQPDGVGVRECLMQAISGAAERGVYEIDYINSHATGTRCGDAVEAAMIAQTWGSVGPPVSSVKGLIGHAMGAAGAIEAVLTLLMLEHGFIAPTANLEHVSDDCAQIQHVQTLIRRPIETALKLSSGLGGTNACLVFQKWKAA
jgi:3-oxoacyl-[acyl-carrier-protein] synthase-1